MYVHTYTVHPRLLSRTAHVDRSEHIWMTVYHCVHSMCLYMQHLFTLSPSWVSFLLVEVNRGDRKG